MIDCAYCGDPIKGPNSGPVTPGPREIESLPYYPYPEINGYDCVTWLCPNCKLTMNTLIETLWELPNLEEVDL